MRFYTIIFSSLFLIACGSSKDTVTDRDTTTESSEDNTQSTKNNRVIGIVKDVGNGCGFCIETETAPNTKKLLLPLNLDSTYMTQGTKIKFEFARSRKAMPENCDADIVVKVYEVTRMR